MDKIKLMEGDKENNYRSNYNTTDNKELIHKLKKLNKTLPIK